MAKSVKVRINAKTYRFVTKPTAKQTKTPRPSTRKKG